MRLNNISVLISCIKVYWIAIYDETLNEYNYTQSKLFSTNQFQVITSSASTNLEKANNTSLDAIVGKNNLEANFERDYISLEIILLHRPLLFFKTIWLLPDPFQIIWNVKFFNNIAKCWHWYFDSSPQSQVYCLHVLFYKQADCQFQPVV